MGFNKQESTAWQKAEKIELELKGYSEQDITLLQSINELSKEALVYALTNYIHNSVSYKNEWEKGRTELGKLRKSESFYKSCAETAYGIE